MEEQRGRKSYWLGGFGRGEKGVCSAEPMSVGRLQGLWGLSCPLLCFLLFHGLIFVPPAGEICKLGEKGKKGDVRPLEMVLTQLQGRTDPRWCWALVGQISVLRWDLQTEADPCRWVVEWHAARLNLAGTALTLLWEIACFLS